LEASLRPAVYTVAEVAFLLQTSEWNVYGMIRRDEIPGVRMIGTKYRILRSIFNREYAIDPSEGAEAS
jgi:excisionase family DNA binding protein